MTPSPHDKLFKVADAHRLEDPERLRWLPPDEVLPHLGLEAGMTVVDVGAGTGYFALPIARRVGPRGRVYAVDLQEGMLDRIRPKLAEPGAPGNVTLVAGRAEATTLAAGVAEVLLLANVWHELEEREAFLREAARVLKPGGRLAILDWRPDVERPPGPPIEHRVAREEVVARLAAAGWRVLVETGVGPYSYLVVARRP